MGALRISVCLPTWNGERELARLLPALARQQVAGGFELVAIDSDSQDGTRSLLERAGARVERIAQAEFGHGRTRNALARLARGPILAFLSQDAEPAADDYLERLAEPFADPEVAAVAARILPRPTDDALTRRTALESPDAADEPRTLALAAGERWEALAPQERVARARLNDVASAIRAERLAELPFPELAFGEDVAWAARALQRGWRIAFEPRALVLHAHRYGPRAAYARNRTDAAFLRAEFGLVLRPGALSVLKGFAHELRADLRFVSRHGGWPALARAPFLRAAQVLGQRAGSLAGPLAGPLDRAATG
jgi:rhamnosyltransferase